MINVCSDKILSNFIVNFPLNEMRERSHYNYYLVETGDFFFVMTQLGKFTAMKCISK